MQIFIYKYLHKWNDIKDFFFILFFRFSVRNRIVCSSVVLLFDVSLRWSGPVESSRYIQHSPRPHLTSSSSLNADIYVFLIRFIDNKISLIIYILIYIFVFVQFNYVRWNTIPGCCRSLLDYQMTDARSDGGGIGRREPRCQALAGDCQAESTVMGSSESV